MNLIWEATRVDGNASELSARHFNFRYEMREIALILGKDGSHICVLGQRKYFTGYIKRGMRMMISSFFYLCESSDSTRCCKQSFGSFRPCRYHSDTFILLSTRFTSSQRCSARWRYEERLSSGRKREVSATSKKNPAATSACEMASYLPACVHLNNAAWPQRPRLCTRRAHIQRDSWDHTLFLHSSSRGSGGGARRLIFPLFADWSGKWQPSASPAHPIGG